MNAKIFSTLIPHLYDNSKELELLAARLGIPVQELTQLIEEGKIPRRRWVNKKGHRYGPVVVLIHDVGVRTVPAVRLRARPSYAAMRFSMQGPCGNNDEWA